MVKLLLLLAPHALLALSNSVTIYEAAGQTQTGRPLSISRWFARGEIANYPRPYLAGGAAITPWQADVKTRWDDGSVQFAIVSLRQDLGANGSVTVEFRNATSASSSPGNTGLTAAQLLGFNGGSWGAKIETTSSGVTQGADARAMLGALASAPDQIRCWLCGPVVTQMIVEDRTTSLAYDWGYQGSPATLTGVSAGGAIWTKATHGLSNGDQVYVTYDYATGGSVPAGITEGATYYVVGAMANTFGLSATPGGTAVTTTSAGSNVQVYQRYASASWAAADTAHKSLHPIFVITAYAGWPGVRVEHILENVWASKIQDQYFASMKLYSGASNGTTAANLPGFIHSSRSRWRKLCWDGAAPAGEPVCGTDAAVVTPRAKGVQIDYNFPYMIYSGQSLPLDTTRQNVAFRVTDLWACWTAGNCDPRNDASRADVAATNPPGTVSASGVLHSRQYQTGVDQWGLIGPEPTIAAIHRYVMGDVSQTMETRLRAAELAIDANYAQAYWSTHYREDNPAKKYLSPYEEPGQATPAFGKPLSMDARPTLTTQFPQSSTASPGDRIVRIGEARIYCDLGDCEDTATIGGLYPHHKGGDASVFNSDVAHSWMPIFESYLLTGDWYALEELQFWASWYQTTGATQYMSGEFDAGGSTGAFGTHSPWAIFTNPENYRARAWGMRSLGYAIAATPTEDPAFAGMRQYLMSHYRLNILTMEGVVDARDGVFAATFPSFGNWSCGGWDNTAMTLPGVAADNPLTAWCWGRMNQAHGVPNPLKFPQWFWTHNKPFEDYSKTNEHDAPWHWWYMFHSLVQHAQLGVADAKAYIPNFQRFWVDSASSLSSAYLMSAGTIPVTDRSSMPFQSWTEVAGAFQPGFSTMNQWCEGESGQGTPPWCGSSSISDVHSGPVTEYKGMLALSEPENGTTTGYSGRRAWDWVRGAVPHQNRLGTAGYTTLQVDPRYAWIPQFIRNVQVSPGATEAIVRWSSFSADSCRVGITTGAFATADDTGDAIATMQGQTGRYVVTGLSPSTTYRYRVTCGPGGGTARILGTFTTTAGGASSVTLRLAPPPSFHATQAVVDFGESAVLGASSAPVSCPVSCSLTIAAPAGRVFYYRVRFLNASGASLPGGGGAQQAIP